MKRSKFLAAVVAAQILAIPVMASTVSLDSYSAKPCVATAGYKLGSRAIGYQINLKTGEFQAVTTDPHDGEFKLSNVVSASINGEEVQLEIVTTQNAESSIWTAPLSETMIRAAAVGTYAITVENTTIVFNAPLFLDTLQAAAASCK